MPLPGVVPLPASKKQAILSDLLAGTPQVQAAEKHGVHIATISRIWKRFRQAGSEAFSANPSIDKLKQSIIEPGFAAILRSLRDMTPSGSHKAAATAIAALKGIGIFQPDAPNLSLHFSQPPTSWSTAVSALTAAQPTMQLPAPAASEASEASNSDRESQA